MIASENGPQLSMYASVYDRHLQYAHRSGRMCLNCASLIDAG